MVMEEYALDECPVSYITPESAELVMKYNQARRQKKTLSRMVGREDAFTEDVEETLTSIRLAVKDAFEKESERNNR